MAIDLFLHLDSIPGTSTNDKFTGQFEITSYALDGKNPTTAAIGSGGGAGKVTLGPLIVTRLIDTASVPLFLALCTGVHIKTATLTAIRVGKDQQTFLKYDLTEVTISEIATAPSPTAFPAETISLSYRTIQLSIYPQKADGSLGTPIVGGWDTGKNAKI